MAIARARVLDPRILFLDEPISGLALEYLQQLKSEGRTIFLATQKRAVSVATPVALPATETPTLAAPTGLPCLPQNRRREN